MAVLGPQQRSDLLTPLLDCARKKLVIHAESLQEVDQQQLQRVNQVINDAGASMIPRNGCGMRTG
jgi:hypothetical protein